MFIKHNEFQDGRQPYNATVYSFINGKPFGISVGHARLINGRLQLTRANGVSCTGYEDRVLSADLNVQMPDGEEITYTPGDAAYDVYLTLRYPQEARYIVLDDCAGFKAVLNRMMGLPPAYKV